MVSPKKAHRHLCHEDHPQLFFTPITACNRTHEKEERSQEWGVARGGTASQPCCKALLAIPSKLPCHGGSSGMTCEEPRAQALLPGDYEHSRAQRKGAHLGAGFLNALLHRDGHPLQQLLQLKLLLLPQRGQVRKSQVAMERSHLAVWPGIPTPVLASHAGAPPSR